MMSGRTLDRLLVSPEDFTPYINRRECSATVFALFGILALRSGGLSLRLARDL